LNLFSNNLVLNLAGEKKLKGTTELEQVQVNKWISFFNTEVISTSARIFLPLLGKAPYNKKDIDAATERLDTIIQIIEARLSEFTYLVGERITVADLFAATVIGRSLETIFDKAWISKHQDIFRWFSTVSAHPVLSWRYVDFKPRDKPVEYVPPKKEKKEKKKEEKPKQEKKPAPAAAEQSDEPPVEKKAKHPLEALGKPKLAIDEWKRFYSNEETRESAIPWFWEHFDADEWSLWKVTYKYNDELTLTFMSNNLIGGFFARLTGSIKYMFGCAVVYGENNNNGIIGGFMVRGQDYKPAFEVAPDWESYSYEKLDPNSEEDREFFNNMLAWDKPIVVNGEEKEIADGKVLK